MIDEIRRLALFTSGVAELTLNRAEAIVRDLVKAGEVPRQQAAELVRDLVERSRANRAEFTDLLRSEIKRQMSLVGLASSRDFARLERRVARLEAATPGAGQRASSSARKRKSTARKSTARKKTSSKKSTTGSSSHGSQRA